MLKSTYVPSPNVAQRLPPGWTEHKAPTGHTYYYNAETKQSTYTRPAAAPAPANPMASYQQHQAVPQMDLSNPAVANAFMAQYSQQPPSQPGPGGRGGFAGRGGRGGHESRPRPQPVDKPRSKVPIPGCEPWILVYTKYGRRFAYNPAKNASYWRIPDKLTAGILELDQARIRRKAEGGTSEQGEDDTKPTRDADAPPQNVDDSSEYEEVEVTDDEAGDDDDAENPPKRQRTEDLADPDQPVEYTEADIAAQLAAMGADYGEDPDEYDEAHEGEDWPMEEADAPLSEEDARELFKDLLDDFKINPYSPWDKLIEEGRVFDDPRYTVLGTMKARKEVWEEWSRSRITALKAQRTVEEKKDPRIAYLALLQDKATPKLFWPEFRRKYKKEDAMKDARLSDKDREKLYREHINRLKMPPSTLKSDLKKLMESVPLAQLNNTNGVSTLPPAILTDVRYISMDPKVRDPFIEGYIEGLGPPPEGAEPEGDEAAAAKAAKEERRKRERALEERERAVAAEKQRQEKKLAFSRARLRDEERELESAMQVGKRGLQSQLAADRQA